MKSPTNLKPSNYMSEIKFDTGIPIPPKKTKPTGIYYKAGKEIKVGESYLCDSRASAQTMAQAMKQSGFKATTRREGFKQVRVWRLE